MGTEVLPFSCRSRTETTEHAEKVKNAQVIKFKEWYSKKKEQFLDHQIIQL